MKSLKEIANLQEENADMHVDRAKMCNECKGTFTTKFKLKRHVAQVHDKQKPFECSICHKSFSQKGNLFLHNKNVHQGLKRVKPHKQCLTTPRDCYCFHRLFSLFWA